MTTILMDDKWNSILYFESAAKEITEVTKEHLKIVVYYHFKKS